MGWTLTRVTPCGLRGSVEGQHTRRGRDKPEQAGRVE